MIDRRRRRKLAVIQGLRRRTTRLGLGCAALALLALVAGILALSLAYASLVNHLPSPALLPEMFDAKSGVLMQPTRVYDRSGQQLLYSLENPGVTRRYLSLDAQRPNHFSPQLVRVTLGVLDASFWQGPGFSLSQWSNLEPVTISERLVNDLLLWQEPRGLRRALRMRVLAAQVVARYGHVKVLEWYLNSAAYGHMAFGADSAARLYLEKSATNLDLAESALLLAASQAPALNPLDAPAAALERQGELLDGLQASGVISADEHRQAAAEKITLAHPLGPEASPAAAFSRLVLNSLSERFGSQRLERGGLRIITTLDYSLQQELSCLTRTQLARLTDQPDEISFEDGSPCSSARLLPTLPPGSPLPRGTVSSAVVLDTQTGQVLALLGDTTYLGERTGLSPRAPGSLLTPFVAVAGFARGFGPASLMWDIPSSLPEELAARPNPDGAFHGPVRMRIALANDYLAPQAQMLAQMGAASVWRLASAFGLTSLADETAEDILYSGGRVSPLDMAQAYGVFAAQGQRAGQQILPGGDLRPAMVLYVEDLNGNALFDGRQSQQQAVASPQLAYLVHHVLSDATARWPSLGYPNPLEIGRPSAAKIGQVEGNTQAWAVGYTPQRVAVFWLGLPDGAPNGDGGVVNARMPAGMWHAMMQYAVRNMAPSDWQRPPGISTQEVCDPSGQLPTPACPQVVSEVFLNGNEPTAADSLYRILQINRETGRLATIFTPAALIESKIFLVPPAQARDWALAAQLPVPPEEYDAIQPPESSPTVRLNAPKMFAYVHGKVVVQGSAAGEGFRAYQVLVGQGLNPDTWLQVGEEGTSPVTDGELAEWDTQGQEGLYAVRLQVVRQDQTVETATIQVTVDNTPPLVRIPYPIQEQTFEIARDKTITFQVEAQDAIGIDHLQWRLDGRVVGESIRPPYSLDWTARRGSYVLEVRAIDLAGNEGVSEQVRFTVK